MQKLSLPQGQQLSNGFKLGIVWHPKHQAQGGLLRGLHETKKITNKIKQVSHQCQQEMFHCSNADLTLKLPRCYVFHCLSFRALICSFQNQVMDPRTEDPSWEGIRKMQRNPRSCGWKLDFSHSISTGSTLHHDPRLHGYSET